MFFAAAEKISVNLALKANEINAKELEPIARSVYH